MIMPPTTTRIRARRLAAGQAYGLGAYLNRMVISVKQAGRTIYVEHRSRACDQDGRHRWLVQVTTDVLDCNKLVWVATGPEWQATGICPVCSRGRVNLTRCFDCGWTPE